MHQTLNKYYFYLNVDIKSWYPPKDNLNATFKV